METDSVWKNTISEIYAAKYEVKLSLQAHRKISQELLDELQRASRWKDNAYKEEVIEAINTFNAPVGMFGFNVSLTFDHMTLIQRVMEEGISHTVSDPIPGKFEELGYLYDACNSAVEAKRLDIRYVR